MSFTPLALGLSAVLVVYLAVVSPLTGKRTYDRLGRTRDQDPGAYRRTFTLWSAELWVLAVVALVIVAIEPNLDLADIGLVTDSLSSTGLGTVAGVVLAMTAALFARRWATSKASKVAKAAKASSVSPSAQAALQQKAVSHLLPRTAVERWYAAGLSVTAGVTEEIVFRGLLIAVGTEAFGLSREVAAACALAIFVAGHAYQGWFGMLAVTAAGFGLTFVYFRTGDLLVPVVVHVMIDLFALAFAQRPRTEPVRETELVREAA
ncbi:CPBP family intramembrane glutamic endopeptidase [Streptosporangium algeriense]|uniref:CPBP family intramembrane glutamic endopeptidase n=1 Tax=Streptosporangium algeriense TaxID=1682748 RepID=A0ABW3DVH3_9ACTN